MMVLSKEMGEVKLFRTWSSPYALRIVWALKLKGVEYETVYEDLANKSSLLFEYNPAYKKVPVLLHNGTPICESLAKFNDDQVAPSVFRAYASQGVEQEEAIGPALENLDVVEKQLTGKKFFNGESFGFLDLVFGWIAKYLGIFEETGGIKLFEEDRFPLIMAWKDKFSDIPVIKENWPDQNKLITKFQLMCEYFVSNDACCR
ncbi:hypothetical protein L1987_00935 [Smallanthus sonchifolius]|uniref:Uncharacterized protein n=1 Tax=Smallanthus sonchifolius TaxID=185202 RepID=A0ACB9K3I3_9ASTR|nr:hypothetical protein L1987_00935 [Smallanthus sonchifolius]